MDAAAAQALPSRALEESAEELYEEAPCGYVSFSLADGTITRANKTFLQWSGRDREDLVGALRFQDLLSKAGRILYEARCLPMLRLGGTASAVMLEVLRANGERLPVLANTVVRLDASNVPLLVRMTAFDATERRRYERGLLEARNKAEAAEAEARRALSATQAAHLAKERFLAAMNHEFRTPIGIVLGFSELLLQGARTGRSHPRQAEYLADVRTAAKHLLGLVEDSTRYAELSRIDGKEQLRRTWATAETLVSTAMRLAGAELVEAGIVAVLPAAVSKVDLWVDTVSMAEAIACILREVARRAPHGAPTEVSCRSEPEGVIIEVHCAALNLSEGTLLALPDAREVHSRGLEGAGVGFAIAAHIIDLHKGYLRVEAAPGGGASILVTVPHPAKQA